MISLPRRAPVLKLRQAVAIAGAATVISLFASALWGLTVAMVAGTCVVLTLVVARTAIRRSIARPVPLPAFRESELRLYQPAPRVILSPDESGQLFGEAPLRAYTALQAIFHERDRPNALYFIERGRVAVTVTGLDGQQLTFDIMGPGEVFGEIGLLSDESHPERSATIRTLEQTVTRVLRQADFERMRDEDGALDGLLLRILRHRVMRLHAQLKEALYVPSEQRVLRRLVDLEQVWSEGPGDTLIRVTRDELADLAGTHLAKVNGILRTEERRGTLEVRSPRRIAILDLITLKRHAVTGLPVGSLEWLRLRWSDVQAGMPGSSGV